MFMLQFEVYKQCLNEGSFGEWQAGQGWLKLNTAEGCEKSSGPSQGHSKVNYWTELTQSSFAREKKQNFFLIPTEGKNIFSDLSKL